MSYEVVEGILTDSLWDEGQGKPVIHATASNQSFLVVSYSQCGCPGESRSECSRTNNNKTMLSYLLCYDINTHTTTRKHMEGSIIRSFFPPPTGITGSLVAYVEDNKKNGQKQLISITLPTLSVEWSVSSILTDSGERPVPTVTCVGTFAATTVLQQGIGAIPAATKGKDTQSLLGVSFEHWIGCSDGSILVVDAPPYKNNCIVGVFLTELFKGPVTSIVPIPPAGMTSDQNTAFASVSTSAGTVSVVEVTSRKVITKLPLPSDGTTLPGQALSRVSVLGSIPLSGAFDNDTRQLFIGFADGTVMAVMTTGRPAEWKTRGCKRISRSTIQQLVVNHGDLCVVSPDIDSMKFFWLTTEFREIISTTVPRGSVVLFAQQEKSVFIAGPYSLRSMVYVPSEGLITKVIQAVESGNPTKLSELLHGTSSTQSLELPFIDGSTLSTDTDQRQMPLFSTLIAHTLRLHSDDVSSTIIQTLSASIHGLPECAEYVVAQAISSFTPELSPVLLAASRGLHQSLHLLVMMGAPLTVTDCSSNTALHYVCCPVDTLVHCKTDKEADPTSRLIIVGELVSQQPQLLHVANSDGQLPLHVAACTAAVFGSEISRRLISAAPDAVNAPDAHCLTPLHYAAIAGAADVVRLIVDAGAILDLVGGNSKRTALHLAAIQGSIDVIQILLNVGADPCVLDFERRTPAHLAALAGNVQATRVLMSAAARRSREALWTRDSLGRTILHCVASGCPDPDLIREIALAMKNKYGAKHQDDLTYCVDHLGHTAAHVVSLTGHYACPDSVSSLTGLCGRVLHETPVEVSQCNVVEGLLACFGVGISPLATDSIGLTPMHNLSAVAQVSPEIRGALARVIREYILPVIDTSSPHPFDIPLLVSSESSSDAPVMSLLHLLSLARDESIFSDLIALGVSPGATDSEGQTLLHAGVVANSTALVRKSIDIGVPLNTADTRGRTALHYAAEQGASDLVTLLLSAGADPRCHDSDGLIPADIAPYDCTVFDSVLPVQEYRVCKQARDAAQMAESTINPESGMPTLIHPLRLRALPGTLTPLLAPEETVVALPTLGQVWVFTTSAWGSDSGNDEDMRGVLFYTVYSALSGDILVSNRVIPLDVPEGRQLRVAGVGPFLWLWTVPIVSSQDDRQESQEDRWESAVSHAASNITTDQNCVANVVTIIDGRTVLRSTELFVAQGSRPALPVFLQDDGRLITLLVGAPNGGYEAIVTRLLSGESEPAPTPFVTQSGDPVIISNGQFYTEKDGKQQVLAGTTTSVIEAATQSPLQAPHVPHMYTAYLPSSSRSLMRNRGAGVSVAPLSQVAFAGGQSVVAVDDFGFIACYNYRISPPDPQTGALAFGFEVAADFPTPFQGADSLIVSFPRMLLTSDSAPRPISPGYAVILQSGRLGVLQLNDGKFIEVGNGVVDYGLISMEEPPTDEILHETPTATGTIERGLVMLTDGGSSISCVILRGASIAEQKWTVKLLQLLRDASNQQDDGLVHLVSHCAEGKAEAVARSLSSAENSVLMDIDIILGSDPNSILGLQLLLLPEAVQPQPVGLMRRASPPVQMKYSPCGPISLSVHEDNFLRMWHIRGDGPLHLLAAGLGSLFGFCRAMPLETAVERLISAGFDPEQRSLVGETPLITAARTHSPALVRQLLAAGASPNASTLLGETALELAAVSGDNETVHMLSSAGVDATISSTSDFPPLHSLAFCGLTEALRTVLESIGPRGASCTNKSGWTPLHAVAAVCMTPDEELDPIASNFVRAGNMQQLRRHLRSRCGDGLERPLAIIPQSASDSIIGVLDILGNKGANVNAEDTEGRRPLHLAALHGNSIVAGWLLDHGAEASPVDARRQTPLHVATLHRGDAVIRQLLAAGADANMADSDSLTPLHNAARGGDEEAVAQLIAIRGVNTDAQDARGQSPLHYAVSAGFLSIVRSLLEAGANPNLQTTEGDTPLHIAAASGTIELCFALISGGAGVNLLNARHYTPLDLVPREQRIEMLRRIVTVPQWLSDHASTTCAVCRLPFNATRKRNHCRLCGRLTCSICTRHKAMLPMLSERKEQRICSECRYAVSDELDAEDDQLMRVAETIPVDAGMPADEAIVQ